MTASDSLSGRPGSVHSDRAADGSRPRPLVGWLSDARRFSLGLSVAVVLIGLVVLVGWAIG
ncbi:MAG TPA: hypothetical protein VF337_05065, partial [Candidatus Limnocylindrales bacterium]